MQRSVLVLGLAAVFAGLTAVLMTAAIAFRSLVLLFVAAPFGVVTYLMWMQASGRFAEMHQRRAEEAENRRERGGFGAEARETGGFGAGARRAAREAKREARTDGARAGPTTVAADTGPSPAEARRILGVDPDADEKRVRQAYREKVKTVHPDADNGDEERFKEVTEAYETLAPES